jgi:S1-C subfamily serine protease
MDGFAIPDSAALSAYLALEASPGDTIPVEVLRDGQRRTVQLTLGERPEPN